MRRGQILQQSVAEPIVHSHIRFKNLVIAIWQPCLDVGAGLRGQPELESQTGIVGGGEAVSAHGHGVDGPLPLLEVGTDKLINIQS